MPWRRSVCCTLFSLPSSRQSLPHSLLTFYLQAPSRLTPCHHSTIRNGRPAAPSGLQCSRLSVQHGRSASFASSLAALPASLGSSAAIAATGCAASFALIGLTSRCFVPQFAIVALLRYRLQVSFAHWTSASPVSRTARGEAPSHWARASCAPLLARGAFWVVAQPYEVALSKSLPLAPKGGGTAQP